MILESRADTATFRLKEETKVAALETEERDEATKPKVQAAEEAVASVGAQAVEEFKKLMEFRAKVGEATYDAFLKEFIECKGKDAEAFPNLDLKDIVAKEPEDQEEEENGAKTTEEALS